MRTRKGTGRARRSADNGAYWISYSDMMASLLLVFIMAVLPMSGEHSMHKQRNWASRRRRWMRRRSPLPKRKATLKPPA